MTPEPTREPLPGLHLLPVVHERIEMAAVVRAACDALDPRAVAVELPTTVAEAVGRAVRRLPRISLLVTREPGEEALVWVAAPGDPFVEGLRWAVERRRPIFCVDPDLPYEERRIDAVPDPYAVWELGPARYLVAVAAAAGAAPASDADRRRERGMAYHLGEARAAVGDGPLLALVGAAHVDRLAADLGRPAAHPFARTRRAAVELRHLHPRSLTALLPDPPLAHAVWERLRRGGRVPPADLRDTFSRRVSFVRHGLRVIAGEGGEEEAARRERLVRHACAEGVREGPAGPFPDRRALARVVWGVGAGSYREQTGADAAPWQGRLFFDFARRCAAVQGQLAPGLYEWTVAARGVGDDNLAWEVFSAARTYPWQEETAELETATVEGSELDLGTRRLRFRRRFFRSKGRPLAVPVRERPGPEEAAGWLAGFDDEGICSYPPEDLVIEDYGRFLQRKAVSVLAAERSRSEPFTTALLDGIDFRETMRRFHEGKVWVREEGRAPGEAGSVVVIFDPDPDGRRFPFAMTWLGEHDQESDMAFYSTDPADQVVGPGILRATYGGFLLTQPRGRLLDVWTDPDYRWARTRPEVLLMAAVDYSVQRIVVHVAAAPPPERLKRYAAMQRKQLVHLPLASLSPVSREKVRVLHLLAGRGKREIAPRYVW
ncbi:MAG: hypothetical protein R3325_10615 [Thermoanaerobaculia bacterium]|nr:hypothetical protein [Thermoanaerobaculia bacterium]